MIALVDYGAGNLTSVRKALGAIGASFWTPAAPSEIADAAAVVVPGVGHFSATAALDEPWRDAIRRALAGGRPLLGICVGLQWLFDGSTEAPDVPGLGVVAGTCRHLGDRDPDARTDAGADGLKIPHVGWNDLTFPRPTRLFDGLADGTQVYFTHSFAAPVVAATAAVTTYGVAFSAAVEDGLVSGVQFHPEKSGDAGLRILRNWAADTGRR
ncbi:MAG: imidazole glycerol phosphate synthase subunit HisH [Vicinamibacterales bacterium]